jgi:protein ImuB
MMPVPSKRVEIMSRIVSVWLPQWPVQRFMAAQARGCPVSHPVDPDQPFVLAMDAPGGPRIAALNAAAGAAGLSRGDQVADARAKAGALQVQPVDPAADRVALGRLALWTMQYTPAVSPWGEENGADGLFLDVMGAAHLFGGEKMLLTDLSHRLDRLGLSARLAIAGTAGTAWAFSHFQSSPAIALEPEQEREGLASLPVEALRLSPDTCRTLRRLGFKRIGSLLDEPRAPFAARFPTELLLRLDQALGHAPEPLGFIVSPQAYHCRRQLLEPITTQEAIVAGATLLMQDLVPTLANAGKGARNLRLALYRVDGEVATVDLGLTVPTRDPAHVARLFDLRLERIVETIDAGFGFEALSLTVTAAERMMPEQTEFASASGRERAQRHAALIDSLRQRLGARRVRQLEPVASHLPERAEVSCASTGPQAWPAPDEARVRPLLLLPRAEPAEVVALVPEGPPKRFRWRKISHDVVRSQGPERIAAEWWRHRTAQPTRDYYLVEDDAGRRFWLYREGLYARETSSPRWYVHGVFA